MEFLTALCANTHNVDLIASCECGRNTDESPGYQHPWVAPLLAECPGDNCLDCDALIDDHRSENYPGFHDCYMSPSCRCQGTGKRYPQLWKWCEWWRQGSHTACGENIFRDKTHVCDGSGWIPNITTVGLWDVAGDIGMSSVVDKLPYDMIYDWMMMLSEEQRMEALAKAITMLQTTSLATQ